MAGTEFDQKALVQMCQQTSFKPSEMMKIKKKLFQLCQRTCFGQLDLESLISKLSEVSNIQAHFVNMIADILCALDIFCEVRGKSGTRRRYLFLLRKCYGKIVPESTLKERIELETLSAASIILLLPSETRFIKLKTRLFYKQTKFNLLCESSEGFSKLIVMLNSNVDSNMDAKYALDVIKSLIGCFNLDPNRVLDIILESLTESLEGRPRMYDFCISILRPLCCTSTLSQVLGLKFSFYRGLHKTPKTLYKLTALLVKEELLDLNSIYGLLRPDDSKFLEKQKKEMATAPLYAKEYKSTVSKNKKGNFIEEVPMELDDNDNQKLGLWAAVMDVGDWKNAEKMMNLFPRFYAVSHDFIATKVCSLAKVLTENVLIRMYNRCTIIVRQEEPGSDARNRQEKTFSELFELLSCSGPCLHFDKGLMTDVIDLSKQWMQPKNGSVKGSNVAAIVDVLDRSLLPSLSLMDFNESMASKLWNLLKLFPHQIRYCLYARWRTSTINNHPLIFKKSADALRELKYLMKRLNKENVERFSQRISELCCIGPGELFDYILSQIQTLGNFIVPIVHSLRFRTLLSHDVLTYCIIETLSNSEKDRMKQNSESTLTWLQNLANFGSTLFKHHPIDVGGLLQYVGSQLKEEKSSDLLILREIVRKMAGIEALVVMTPQQLEAMAGGEILRATGGYFIELWVVKKSAKRLKETLLDQRLAIPLCLLIAQQRQCSLFGLQKQSDLTLIGELYDQCQATLVQFSSFLTSNLNMDDYTNRMPTISSLFSEYQIDSDVVFFLWRPIFQFSINKKFEELKQNSTNKNFNKTQKYLDAVQLVVKPIVESIWADIPSQNWNDLSPQIYITFWSLSMYDLSVPTESYTREIAKLVKLAKSKNIEDVEKKRCKVLIAKLRREEKEQHDHVVLVAARLNNEKDTWFNTVPNTETIAQFLQKCVFPRCIFSPVDAIYCAKFLHFNHAKKTPNFSTVMFFGAVFRDISTTVAFCTLNQANHYGLFLCTMLEMVMRWHSDRSVFDQECAHFPGFSTKFEGVATHGVRDSSSDYVDYENYRHVCYEWHKNITTALRNSLDSKNVIQIRNALLILDQLSPHFPVISHLGAVIKSRIQMIKTVEKNKRPALCNLASDYLSKLITRESSFILEAQFHLITINRSFGRKQEGAYSHQRFKRRRI